MAKLNATFISKTSKAGAYTDGLNGLYFVVGKTGGKSWRFKSRINGREIKRTIAYYPAVELKQARILAGDIFSAYKSGIDYFADLDKAQAQADKDTTTFQTISDEWLDIKRTKGDKPSTITTDLKRLNKHIHPVIGNKPIKAIDKPTLRQICDHAAVKTPYTANRLAR